MAAHTFQLDQYAESVCAPMTTSFDVIGAVEWCQTDEVAGTFSYSSVWHPTQNHEVTQWEFRFTDPHAAFDFKMRWC